MRHNKLPKRKVDLALNPEIVDNYGPWMLAPMGIQKLPPKTNQRG